MDVAVLGTGFIGGILGRKLADAGHSVTFGSRDPESEHLQDVTNATVMSVPEAIRAAEVVILAVPAASVAELSAQHGESLEGRLVVDATNRMGTDISNSRAALPLGTRYARAFNTLGGETMAQPLFEEGRADMFFSVDESDRPVVEEMITSVGLRPVYLGADQEELVDALFRLWIALAIGQGRGRHLALRLLEG